MKTKENPVLNIKRADNLHKYVKNVQFKDENLQIF